jgi:hypothetical protein
MLSAWNSIICHDSSSTVNSQLEGATRAVPKKRHKDNLTAQASSPGSLRMRRVTGSLGEQGSEQQCSPSRKSNGNIQKPARTVYPVWSLPVILRIELGRVKGRRGRTSASCCCTWTVPQVPASMCVSDFRLRSYICFQWWSCITHRLPRNNNVMIMTAKVVPLQADWCVKAERALGNKWITRGRVNERSSR